MSCCQTPKENRLLDLSTQEAAHARYVDDQSALIRKEDDVRRSRTNHPVAMLLNLPIEYLGAARKFIVGGTSWWIAILRVLVTIPVDLLEVVGDFTYAHAWLWVGRKRHHVREVHCANCTYRKRLRHDGKMFPADGPIQPLDFCTVDDSCSGTCPRVSWWLPKQLRWLLWLRWFKCAAGRF